MRLTRPEPTAVACAFTGAVWVALFARVRWWIPAGIAAGLALAGVITFWRAHEDGDLMALADATREIPDHVPDQWVRQFHGNDDDTAPARED